MWTHFSGLLRKHLVINSILFRCWQTAAACSKHLTHSSQKDRNEKSSFGDACKIFLKWRRTKAVDAKITTTATSLAVHEVGVTLLERPREFVKFAVITTSNLLNRRILYILSVLLLRRETEIG